jgi:hypothetical protein
MERLPVLDCPIRRELYARFRPNAREIFTGLHWKLTARAVAY